MSAYQTYAFCIDCWELHYGIADSNGVFSRDSGSSNHWDHGVHVFGVGDDYSPPIRGVLNSLRRGELISDGRMNLFSLAIAVEALQPNTGVPVDSERARAADTYVKGAADLYGGIGKDRTRKVSEPISEPDMQDALFGGDAA